jgi:hypothetical protein
MTDILFYMGLALVGIIILYVLYALAWLAAFIYASRKIAAGVKAADFSDVFNGIEYRRGFAGV